MLNLIYDPIKGRAYKDGEVWVNGDIAPGLLNDIEASKGYPEGVDLVTSTEHVITAVRIATKRGILKPGEALVIIDGETYDINEQGKFTSNKAYYGIDIIGELLRELCL